MLPLRDTAKGAVCHTQLACPRLIGLYSWAHAHSVPLSSCHLAVSTGAVTITSKLQRFFLFVICTCFIAFITWFLHVRASLRHHNPSSHFGLLFTLPLCFTLSLGSPSLTCCFLTLFFFSDSRDAPLCSRCSFRILLCVLFVRLLSFFFLFFFLFLVFSWSPDALDMVLSHISRCVRHTYFWISQVMAQTFFSPFFIVYCSAAPHFLFSFFLAFAAAVLQWWRFLFPCVLCTYRFLSLRLSLHGTSLDCSFFFTHHSLQISHGVMKKLLPCFDHVSRRSWIQCPVHVTVGVRIGKKKIRRSGEDQKKKKIVS